MRAWVTRPREEAHLLNPAFCCTALTAAIDGYSRSNDAGVPMPLIFTFLPIALHKPTRELLPPNTRTSLTAWLQVNPSVRVLFFERLISLKPHTREAMQFGITRNWLSLNASGLFETPLSELEITRMIRKLDGEARECVMRARFLGKWFAAAGETHTVMAFWGVRP